MRYPLTFLSPVFSFYKNSLAFVYQKFTILGIPDIQGSELVKPLISEVLCTVNRQEGYKSENHMYTLAVCGENFQ